MKLKEIFAETIKPAPKMTISEWADMYRVIPAKGGAEPGRWRTSRTPYLKEIMDVLSPQHPAKEVIFVKATQIGGTEVGNNLIFYYMDFYPCPMLQVLHTEDIAIDHMRNKLKPSLQVMPHLNKKAIWASGNREGSGKTNISFRGGELKLGWAQTPSTFASRSRRIVVCDDVDRWPSDVGEEGNPVALAKKRADSFTNKKIFINSSPTLKDDSLIWDEFEKSDKRHYYMPCPHCQEFIKFERENFIYEAKDGEILSSVKYACSECGGLIDENLKTEMMSKGKWIAEAPNKEKIGFRLPAYYSPWLGWKEIFKEYEEALKLEKVGRANAMKVWTNTRDALPYEHKFEGDGLDVAVEELLARKEDYGVEVPENVRVLTAGIDTQGNRFEVEVVGWGDEFESWSIDYKIINGDPAEKETQDALDLYLNTLFEHGSGKKIKIYAAAIDTGGNKTQAVYEYAKKRFVKRIFAIKGSSKKDAPITTGRYTLSNKANIPLFSIGVNAAKDEIFAALEKKTPGPFYMHFPNKDIYDEEYFKQFLAERRVNGAWVKRGRKRNEAIDVRVYVRAALAIAGIDLEQLTKQNRFLGVVAPKKPKTEQKNKKTTSSVANYLDEF